MHALRMTARILCFNDQGSLLLISSAKGNAWVTPGGTVELGEELRAAAAREASEEAGVQVRVGRLLFVQDLMRGTERVMEFFFLAELEPGQRNSGTWQVSDPDGPQRTAAWLGPAELAASGKQALPAVLHEAHALYQQGFAGVDPFLGQAR